MVEYLQTSFSAIFFIIIPPIGAFLEILNWPTWNFTITIYCVSVFKLYVPVLWINE